MLGSMAILFEYIDWFNHFETCTNLILCLTSNPYRQFSHAGVESMNGNSVSKAAGDHALFIQGIRMNEANLASGNSVSEPKKVRQLRATSRNRQ